MEGAGSGKCSLRGGENSLEITEQSSAKQEYSLIVIGAPCRLQADLLAEAGETSGTYAPATLPAIRAGDNAATLESFRCFDAAARTASRAAEGLRGTSALQEGSAR
jgi:hypothetical protein